MDTTRDWGEEVALELSMSVDDVPARCDTNRDEDERMHIGIVQQQQPNVNRTGRPVPVSVSCPFLPPVFRAVSRSQGPVVIVKRQVPRVKIPNVAKSQGYHIHFHMPFPFPPLPYAHFQLGALARRLRNSTCAVCDGKSAGPKRRFAGRLPSSANLMS